MTLRVMRVLVASRISAVGVVEAQPVVRKPRLRAVTVSGGAEEVRVGARTATLVAPALLEGRARPVRVGAVRTRRRAVSSQSGVALVSPEDVMKTNKRTQWRRWLLIITAVAAVGGGTAYAMSSECWNCIPCGCASDGGYLMCCDAYAC